MEIKKAYVVSVTSVKGGTGKTTNVLNLAGSYCHLNKKCLIIDLDLYSGDIAPMLNINYDKDIYNFFEDVTNNNFKSMFDYITKYNEYIDILASPKDPRFASKINGKLVSLLLSKVQTLYDVIILDTNHFLNLINLVAFDKSDQILYILNSNLMNLKSMKTFVSIFNNINKKNYKILLYEAREKKKNYISESEISSVVKHDIDFYVPSSFHQKNYEDYVLKGKIMTLNNHKLNKIYRDIIKIIEQVRYEK